MSGEELKSGEDAAQSIDPDMLKLFELTQEEAQEPGRALLTGGVRKLWSVQRFVEFLQTERAGGAPQEPRPPLWQSITGLNPEAEKTLSPERREQALEELVGAVLALLRHEMKAESATKNVFHSIYWDPLAKICVQLGIARAQLSRLSKEATGLAAHELVDVVRIKGVKEKMKEEVGKFITALKKEKGKIKKEAEGDSGSGSVGIASTGALTAMEVWEAMRAARRGPRFHRGVWALGFGFPNYARFYRACLFFYQMSPQQVVTFPTNGGHAPPMGMVSSGPPRMPRG